MNSTQSNVTFIVQQQATVQEQLDTFNITAFLINLSILSILIIIGIYVHKKTVIENGYIQLKPLYGIGTINPFSISEFWKYIISYLKSCIRRKYNQVAVRVYGFEVFQFVTFEIKFFIFFFSFIAFSVAFSFCYLSVTHSRVHLIDFILGDFHFKKDVTLLTILASFLTIGIFIITEFLINDANRSNDYLIESEIKGLQPYRVTSRIALVEDLPQKIEYGNFSNEFGINSDRFIIINFPKLAKLAQTQNDIDSFHENNYYWNKNSKSLLRLFYKFDQKLKQELESNGLLLIQKMREILAKQQKFCGKSLILFQKFEDIISFRQQFRNIKKVSFMIGHKELIVKNMDITEVQKWFRIFLHFLLIIILLFISSPIKLLSTILKVVFAQQFANSLFEDILKQDYGHFVAVFVFPLFIVITSILLTFIITIVSVKMKYSRHTNFQLQIFSSSYFYLLINNFLIPGFTYGTGSSVFEFILNYSSPIEFIQSIPIYQSGSFFSTLILQIALANFLMNYLMIVYWATSRFSFEDMFKKFEILSNDIYRVSERSIFNYGNAYAFDCVIITIACVLGIYQPLIIFSTVVYFGLNAFSHCCILTSLHRDQLFSKNKLITYSLRRIRLAPIVGIVVLAIKSFLMNRMIVGFVNIGLAVVFTVIVLFRPFSSLNFNSFVKQRESKLNEWLHEEDSAILTEKRVDFNEEKQVFINKYIDRTLCEKLLDKTLFI